jgi:hypothetical protein
MTTKITILAVMLALSCYVTADIPEKLKPCVGKLMPMFQGNCISDYAVVATTAVELGWCAKDITKYDDIRFSAQDIVCNCKDCHTVKGNGCMGGNVKQALEYIKSGKNVGGTYIAGAATSKTIATPGPQGYKNCLKYWTKICDPTIKGSNCGNPVYNPADATVCPNISDAEVKCTTDPAIKYADSKISNAIQETINSLTSVE